MLPAGFALETLWNFWPQTLEYLRLDFGIFDLWVARKPTFGLFFWIITGFYFLFTVNREQFRMSNWIPESCKQGLQLINKSSHVILIK